MSSVPRIQSGNVAMPALVYGTAWKREATADWVAEALRQGFRGIDTACQPKHYNEAGVGEGLALAYSDGLGREDLYLQTKFSPIDAHDPKSIPYDPGAPVEQQVEQSFARSLENLGTDYLDGLVLHSPLNTPKATLEAWRALEAIVESGGTKLIGISNCYSLEYLSTLFDNVTIKPSILQNRFYRTTGFDTKLRAFCRERGVIYQSFWTLTANPALLGDPAIAGIALDKRRTPEQVLFRYLTEVGVVPLTGTTSVEHMREDLSIFEFELDASELDAIGALLG